MAGQARALVIGASGVTGTPFVEQEESMDQYPTIKLIVEKGDALALAIGVLPFVGAMVLAAFGIHWLVLAAGAVASAVLYLLMRSYVELVRVIADMLLPK